MNVIMVMALAIMWMVGIMAKSLEVEEAELPDGKMVFFPKENEEEEIKTANRAKYEVSATGITTAVTTTKTTVPKTTPTWTTTGITALPTTAPHELEYGEAEIDVFKKVIRFNATSSCCVSTSVGWYSVYAPEWAFRPDAPYGWVNGRQFKGKDNYYIFPATVWTEFDVKDAVIPARVSFGPAARKGWKAGKWYAASVWEFVGAFQENCNASSFWVTLCGDYSGKPFESFNQRKWCRVPESKTAAYNCLGIRVYEAKDDRFGVYIFNTRIWEKKRI